MSGKVICLCFGNGTNLNLLHFIFGDDIFRRDCVLSNIPNPCDGKGRMGPFEAQCLLCRLPDQTFCNLRAWIKFPNCIKKRLLTDFEALKLWNVRSGARIARRNFLKFRDREKKIWNWNGYFYFSIEIFRDSQKLQNVRSGWFSAARQLRTLQIRKS